MRLPSLALSLLLLTAALPAAAIEQPLGSKNFATPGNVPNYFSSEAAAIQGMRPAAPAGGTTYAVSAPRARVAVAVAAPHQTSRRLVRGRDGHYRFVAPARGGRAATRVAATRVASTRVTARGGGSPKAVHAQLRHAAPARSAARPGKQASRAR